MAVTVAALVLLLALPGLLSRRRHSLQTRAATVAALLAVGLGILNLPAVITEPLPPDLVVIPTRTVPGGELAMPERLRKLVAPEGRITVMAGPGDLPSRLRAARLARAAGPEVVILWNGPWQGPLPATLRAGPGTWALLPGERPPLDPEQVRMRLAGPWAAGRPGKVLLEIGGAPEDLAFEVTLAHPDDPALLSKTSDAAIRQTPASPWELEFQPRRAGPHGLDLEIRTQGYTLEAHGTVPVGPPTRVQVVGFAAPQLARALEVQGLSATAHDRLPPDLRGVVVLLDPVDLQEQARLLRFVDDGGGLFLVGARGGGALPDESQPLHLILPVRRLAARPAPPPPDHKDPEQEREPEGRDPTGRLPPTKPPERPEEKEVDRRSIAMVFLIDRSYSMRSVVAGGRTRMDFARRATVDAARLLRRGDLVGVVSFGNKGKGRVEVPLTDAAEWRRLEKQIEQLRSRYEGTYAADALRKATDLLSRSGAAVRHVVVITDGEIEDARDVGAFAALKVAQGARRAGCTVSVVQVVPEKLPAGAPPVASAPAKALSDAGGGRLARSRSALRIPVVVSTEVRRTMQGAGEEPPESPGKEPDKKPEEKPEEKPGEKPQEEPGEKPGEKPGPEDRRLAVRAVVDSPLLEPEPGTGYPGVFGILPVRGREDAQVLLVAGSEGVPLLAFANRGLGKVGVFSAGLLGSWGREWRQAAAFPAWLAQWVEHLAPARTEVPRQLLRGRKLTPAAPLPGQVAALQGLTGGRVTELSGYPGPRPRSRVRVIRQAADHALFGLAGLLLLLLVEFPGRLRLETSSRTGAPLT